MSATEDTAGERVCRCIPGICTEGDECCESHDCPATPDAGDASEDTCTPVYGSCALLPGHVGPHHGYPENIEAIKAAAATRARAEALREAADDVQSVYDMQCPPIRSHFADDEFGRGAVCAHRWWSTVLGGTLRELRARADSPAGGDR